MSGLEIKYRHSFISLFYFCLVFGYAKFPYLGIPIATLIFFIDWKNFYIILNSDAGKWTIITCSAFFFYSLIRLIAGSEDFFLKNLMFLMALCFKVFVGLYAAYLFSYLIKRNHNSILFFIVLQIFLILISAFCKDIFIFLLQFQTRESVDVFSEIFGIRSLGFGIIHNEGVIFLSLIYVFYFEFAIVSRFRSRIIGLLLYISAFSSRTVFLLVPFWQILKDRTALAISFFIIFGMVYILNMHDGPLYEFFELFITYKDTGVVGARSIDGMLNMQFMPDTLSSWLVGDGNFFSDSGFYRDTDIGFSRIIFFGGVIELIFYFTLNCWPLILLAGKPRVFSGCLLIFLVWTFFVGNIKGISVQNFSFVVYYLFYLLHHKGQI